MKFEARSSNGETLITNVRSREALGTGWKPVSYGFHLNCARQGGARAIVVWHNAGAGRTRMKVTLHDPADLMTLRERARSQANSTQRDRLRAVLLAAEGEDGRELEGDDIAKRLGRSPRFVDQWLARYRKGGLEAIRPGKAKGQKPKLPAEKHAAFKARLLAGPTKADD